MMCKHEAWESDTSGKPIRCSDCKHGFSNEEAIARGWSHGMSYDDMLEVAKRTGWVCWTSSDVIERLWIDHDSGHLMAEGVCALGYNAVAHPLDPIVNGAKRARPFYHCRTVSLTEVTREFEELRSKLLRAVGECTLAELRSASKAMWARKDAELDALECAFEHAVEALLPLGDLFYTARTEVIHRFNQVRDYKRARKWRQAG